MNNFDPAGEPSPGLSELSELFGLDESGAGDPPTKVTGRLIKF